MPDVSHQWGSDLEASANGDLLLVDGDDLTQQRIIKRLMTQVRGYIWHLDYGAGVGQRVGSTLDIEEVTAVIRKQIRLEASVARTPAPEIEVDPILNGVSVSITFYSAKTGVQASLSFDVTA